MLFPAVTGVPGGPSLTITTPSPMCRTACMMRSFISGVGGWPSGLVHGMTFSVFASSAFS